MKRKKKDEAVFTPRQLMESTEFILDRDIISILTDKDKAYTKEEIRNMISWFRNKEVK